MYTLKPFKFPYLWTGGGGYNPPLDATAERERERENPCSEFPSLGKRRKRLLMTNAYFRAGLVLAMLEVVFPDSGLPKHIFIIRETFINRKNGLLMSIACGPILAGGSPRSIERRPAAGRGPRAA